MNRFLFCLFVCCFVFAPRGSCSRATRPSVSTPTHIQIHCASPRLSQCFYAHSHPDPLCFTSLVPMFLRPLASRSIVLHAACPYVPTRTHIQIHCASRRCRRPPQRRQVVGRPPSEGDTELLPIESFQWRSVMLVLFNIRRLYCLLRPFLTAMLV